MSITQEPPKKKGVAYVTMPRSPAVLVSTRDAERLKKRGYVVAPDMEKLPGRHVVYEVDQKALTSKPIGLVNDPSYIRHVLHSMRGRRAKGNVSVRIKDIVDLTRLATITGRDKTTIISKWKKHDDWPKPIIKLGVSEGWYWPDVQAFMERHNLKLRRES